MNRGNPVKNVFLSIQPITVNTQSAGETINSVLQAEKDESLHDESGIDLKTSSAKLLKQDKRDKQEFRERIKQKHREKRIKEKVKKKRYLVWVKLMLVLTCSEICAILK